MVTRGNEQTRMRARASMRTQTRTHTDSHRQITTANQHTHPQRSAIPRTCNQGVILASLLLDGVTKAVGKVEEEHGESNSGVLTHSLSL